MKTCIKCHETKELIYFYIRKSSKDGYRNECKLCSAKTSNLWNNDYKIKLKNKNKLWRESNKEKIKNDINNFHLDNPQYRKEYQLNNKEKINLRNKKRREIDKVFRFKENTRNLIKNYFRRNGFKKK